MLEIRNLKKTYTNGKVAVKDITLTVNSGDIFGFIGHNGAGKTTTLKCVAGLLSYEQGTILIDGIDIKKNILKCKSITCYLPDNPDLFEDLTGFELLNFIINICKIPKKDSEELINYYSTLLNMNEHLNNLISSYSHGMKQKLALISSFIRKPKLLILDEPFVGLDPEAIYLLKKEFRKFCDKGNCIFFSTHVLDVAQNLCDKVAFINDGTITNYGSVSEITKEKTLEEIFMEYKNE